ncbi:MAG: phytanoyl-CoA dioxygenase family protein [Alphaproteobacteria bacterium]|nr:phytanoyl-CoA dioxygenase family protein [Alphaproteobacteria bacterium]MCB9930254.1 phytanoyl-CoA dioxygenase family protein [Alphaproteobacteria bacterium]
MNDMASTLAADYARDGFVFPLDILSPADAEGLRADLEAGEAALADDPKRLGLLRGYPARLLPGFDALVCHPKMIAAASAVLGPDLLVWGSGLFIKEANTPHYVSWHQDLTYWGLDQQDEVTLWVALSPATTESGCMRFVPGSHRERIVPHKDTFAGENLLTRGQELAVDVDESRAVDAVLQTGQASVHHGHLFHASGPNRTGDRRIGAAIRYIAPRMKARSGPDTEVVLVAGEDRFGHFTLVDGPATRMADADFERVAADAARRHTILFEGAGAEGRRRR